MAITEEAVRFVNKAQALGDRWFDVYAFRMGQPEQSRVADASIFQLTASLPTELIWLNADLTRLAQVFINLLNYAAKFTDPQGHVTLRAQLLQAEVVVTMQDTGIGIAADHRERIFDIFE